MGTRSFRAHGSAASRWWVGLRLLPALLAACGDSESSESSGAGSSGAAESSTGPASTSSPDSTGGEASATAGETTAVATTTTAATSTGEPVDDTDGPPLYDVEVDEPPPKCAANVADSIYLLDIDAGLYRLTPDTLEVEPLGQLVCPGASLAMALTIDREGLLWAMLVDDQGYRGIYTIDPDTLACDATAFVDPIAENIGVNSLAFVADAPGSETESLYVGANVGGSFDFSIPLSLGRVDLATMDMEIVGTADLVPTGYYQIADLTGTGDSRLFGFFAGDTPAIAELDDSTGALVSHDLLEIGVGSPWAFAQWAGRLWLFSPGSPGSQIRAYDPVTQAIEPLSDGIGIAVVGAAVSTCAPFEPEG